MEKEDKIREYSAKADLDKIVSINDIEEKEFQGIPLSEDEDNAIRQFRDYRLKKLKKKLDSEEKFHERFEYLQAVSYLIDYRDFLAGKPIPF